jgi:O-antigen/teichoic acid export membrane protein
MMGITTVGVREIAASRGDKHQLSKTFIALLSLTGCTTIAAMLVLLLAMYIIPTLIPYQELLYVGQIKLLSNLFLIEWLFTGLEDFKYITIRTIIIRCLYMASVFLFVTKATDYKLFYILTCGMVLCNAIINVIYSRRFVSYPWKSALLRPYIKPFFIMGAYALLVHVYTSLNSVWLGFVTDTDEVGYFTTATRLHSIVMALLISFTNILFPHVSNLLAEGRTEEFWQKIKSAFDVLFTFAFPTAVFLLAAAPPLLHLFAGDGFEGAYLPMRIISPLVLIVGTEQILVIQILMAMHQDRIVLRNSLIGALIAIMLNILITSSMGAPGSAIVWVISELSIMVLSIVFIRKRYHFSLPYGKCLRYMMAYLPLLGLAFVYLHYINDELVFLISYALTTILYTGIYEIVVVKNQFVISIINRIKSK